MHGQFRINAMVDSASSQDRRRQNERRGTERRRRAGPPASQAVDRRQGGRRSFDSGAGWRRRLLEEIRQLTVIRKLRLGSHQRGDREVRHIDEMIEERRQHLRRRRSDRR